MVIELLGDCSGGNPCLHTIKFYNMNTGNLDKIDILDGHTIAKGYWFYLDSNEQSHFRKYQ